MEFTKWDKTKLIIFLSLLGVSGALVGLDKLHAETMMTLVLGMLSPSVYPYSRKSELPKGDEP